MSILKKIEHAAEDVGLAAEDVVEIAGEAVLEGGLAVEVSTGGEDRHPEGPRHEGGEPRKPEPEGHK